MKVLDVFSDASQNGNRGPCAGAFVIGRGGEPFQLDLRTCRNSMHAEILTAIAALETAVFHSPVAVVCLHSDLKHIHEIMARGRGPAFRLQQLVARYCVRVLTDARQFPEYRLCHHRAQIQAGCHGKRHPLRVPQGPKV